MSEPPAPTPSPELPEPSTAQELMPLVYDDLRALAHKLFGARYSGLTLQPTALVNEVYLRLGTRDGLEVRDREHFFQLAALAMRQILVDHLRARRAAKRGGSRARVVLEEASILTREGERAIDFIDLMEALEALSRVSERQSVVVVARIFGGMTVAEVAEGLGVSRATIENDWLMARAWLHRRLSEPEERAHDARS